MFSRRILKLCGERIDLTKTFSPKRFIHRDAIGIVGIPFCHGQDKVGVHSGPKLIRATGFIDGLRSLGWDVHDYGDLEFEILEDDPPFGPNTIKHPRTNGLANKLISDAVKKSVQEQGICVNLGGDHSLSAGAIYGHTRAHPHLCVIWVDAHADINTALTSYTGHIHGMSGAFPIKELAQFIPKMPGWEWMKPSLKAKDIVYIGLRDIDVGEKYLLDEFNIKHFDIHLVEKYGIAQVMEMALDHINPRRSRPIHLSFDIDGLDMSWAPSTGTPVPGGLTLREGIYIAQEVHSTGVLTGVDIVEVNPELSDTKGQNLTLWAVSLVLQSCFGKLTAGNVPHDFRMPVPEYHDLQSIQDQVQYPRYK